MRLSRNIPQFECKEGCSDCCKSILVGKREWKAIVKRIGSSPHIGPDTTVCPLLKDGRCSVYDIRPAICRLFGTVEDAPADFPIPIRSLKCPHGCGPETKLSFERGMDLWWDTAADGYIDTGA